LEHRIARWSVVVGTFRAMAIVRSDAPSFLSAMARLTSTGRAADADSTAADALDPCLGTGDDLRPLLLGDPGEDSDRTGPPVSSHGSRTLTTPTPSRSSTTSSNS
jgi:hypothetical protein